MHKGYSFILGLSLSANVVIFAMYQQTKTELDKYKKHYAEVVSWADVTQRILKDHLASGEKLNFSKETLSSLEAFHIFKDNDIL